MHYFDKMRKSIR